MLALANKQLALAGATAGANIAEVTLYHLMTHYVSGEDKAAFEAAAPAGIKAAVAKVAANAGVAAWEAGRAARKELF